MASFLRSNEPWAQLSIRGNISIKELDVTTKDAAASIRPTRLTDSVSFVPVPVPHRAEFSDTVAYVITMGDSTAGNSVMRGGVDKSSKPAAATTAVASRDGGTNGDTGANIDRERGQLRVLYCPDTDTWSGWTRSIRDWCEDVDVAMLDATFYDHSELPGRDMSQVGCVGLG